MKLIYFILLMHCAIVGRVKRMHVQKYIRYETIARWIEFNEDKQLFIVTVEGMFYFKYISCFIKLRFMYY